MEAIRIRETGVGEVLTRRQIGYRDGMHLVYELLVVLHLLGWAIVLGGTLVSLRQPRIAPGVLHGMLTALVTGIILAGLASAGGLDRPRAEQREARGQAGHRLVATVLVVRGVRKPAVVTPGYLGAIAGLIVVNVGIAVIWH